jgi:hypothetical protein
MTDLPTRIEAGEATDAEVARFFGWKQTYIGADMRDAWKSPIGGYSYQEPPFTTCLTTLAKECERRGIKWAMADQAEGAEFWIASVGSSDVDWRLGMAPTPAAALCAALVRAVEADNG